MTLVLESKEQGAHTATAQTKIGSTASEVRVFRDWFARMLRTDARITHNVMPWQAEIFLETNTGNRTLSLVRATRFAKDMKASAWEVTGEPIIFSDAGILNDGQTRLKAGIIAGVPFTTHITFGIARRAFRVTGVGAKRTLADVLSIAGESNTSQLAGSLNWLNRYLHGFSSPVLSHLEGLALLEEHPDLRKSLEPGRKLNNSTHLIEPSLAVFLHYVFALKDTDKADAFFEFLTTGIGAMGRHDARHRLRERLISNKGEKAKLPGMQIAALAIKAWNHYHTGKSPRFLRWQTSVNAGAESFPKVL